ncbi:MAG TPA: hypothetical protein VI386_23470 [Candidatus Sulfotelmatobacter sp.]
MPHWLTLLRRIIYLLVDYYTPLVGHPEDFKDGIHPNAAGYVLMEAALSAVLVQ